jgi:hypothetical protein
MAENDIKTVKDQPKGEVGDGYRISVDDGMDIAGLGGQTASNGPVGCGAFSPTGSTVSSGLENGIGKPRWPVWLRSLARILDLMIIDS